jgi:hypothetical protein
MNRGLLALLFLSVFGILNCEQFLHNYNADEHLEFINDIIQRNDTQHGAGALFLAGMFDGLHIFDNITYRNECLSVWPIIHDDVADIISIVRNITSDKDIFDALRLIIDKVEDLFTAMHSRKDVCMKMRTQIRSVLMKVGKFLKVKGRFNKMWSHFFSNFGMVIMKFEEARQVWLSRQWYQSGYIIGDLVSFVSLWDFQVGTEITKIIN